MTPTAAAPGPGEAMDILEKREIRFLPRRPARASVARWEATLIQALHMLPDHALRLPRDAKRGDVTAAVRRYAPGKLFVRSDVDGRLILTRRKDKKAILRYMGQETMVRVSRNVRPGEIIFTHEILPEPGFFQHLQSSARPGSHDANGSPVEGEGG